MKENFEDMIIEPPEEIVKRAHVKDWEKEIEKGKDIEEYWKKKAKDFKWFKKWDMVLDDSNKPFYKWFVNGKTNITYNAVDRWIKTGKRNKVAIIYTSEKEKERKLTYYELYTEVNKMANALKRLGVKKGDVVCLYLPMCPELVISMLACAKIGAIHTVVFSGLSVGALEERIRETNAKVVITADATFRRGRIIKLKDNVDEAVAKCPSVETIVVVNHANVPVKISELTGREFFYDKLIEGEDSECPPEKMDAEDPLFILYTSGSTGKPKGVLHTVGGYMVGVSSTLKMVFDIHDDDLYFCTADIGWITGHSYIVYGPLLLGTTTIIYEGAPDYPDPAIWWRIIEKYGVTKFYTAPTALRHLRRFGDRHPKKYNLSTLKILGTVGEPIDPETWLWYYKVIGNERCPIMDTWWQTETGMHMISPLPTAPLKPGSVTKPLPGIDADIVNKNGDPVKPGEKGYVVIKKPWPAMMRTIYKDEKRYREYWETIPGYYLATDVGKKDKDSYFWILGRSDDVINISGHRIGTAEVESALISHPDVAEAAVIGKPDPIKGNVIKAFLVLKNGKKLDVNLMEKIKEHVKHEIGPIAVIGEMEQVDKLPKTRSGKVMRRILRAKELGEELGDTSTLED
ncbi:acetyl-coenzyme A synthetase [Methanothermus fervidus DSM 2088]|uniref:Acetate--CoA ligase n=1 Tax=Methanothermus fervidus (strain ATCC 43054 / DSM 2088 / JCM 10308 / V24 S) TaxID=523846 RepID=E3GWY9_METFV|nr:acetate--CoA ligase [Methanothermus fervidus]ADP76878.1 acetyl-coenzyme A synthetase [Methanothermus fervidus DSM 2088]